MSADPAKQAAAQKIAEEIRTIMDSNLLLQAMETEDDVGRILRSHLLIEQTIETFLGWTITDNMKPVVKVPQQFNQKIVLATALGLPQQIAVAASTLNTIRNKVAHRVGATLETADVSNFTRAVNNVREILDVAVPPLEESSIEVAASGIGKVSYGAKGLGWDFRIAVGMFQMWTARYVSFHGANLIKALVGTGTM